MSLDGLRPLQMVCHSTRASPVQLSSWFLLHFLRSVWRTIMKQKELSRQGVTTRWRKSCACVGSYHGMRDDRRASLDLLTLWRRVIVVNMSKHPLVHDLLATTRNENIFLHEFPELFTKYCKYVAGSFTPLCYLFVKSYAFPQYDVIEDVNLSHRHHCVSSTKEMKNCNLEDMSLGYL